MQRCPSVTVLGIHVAAKLGQESKRKRFLLNRQFPHSSHPATHLTISKCPAQMALCKAVIPSSFAALGFGTCVAVFRTNSSSPSKLASKSSASGSKLTLRANFTFCVPLDRRLLRATDSFDSQFFSEFAEDIEEMDEDLLCSELFDDTSSQTV